MGNKDDTFTSKMGSVHCALKSYSVVIHSSIVIHHPTLIHPLSSIHPSSVRNLSQCNTSLAQCTHPQLVCTRLNHIMGSKSDRRGLSQMSCCSLQTSIVRLYCLFYSLQSRSSRCNTISPPKPPPTYITIITIPITITTIHHP